MDDFFEIDFLDVESDKSGDAIALRYRVGGLTYIHIVDAGFQDTGQSVANHVRKYYDAPTYLDHVVATHPDGDHAGGLRTVLESFTVGHLWMLRPWSYAAELLPRFTRIKSVGSLIARLKEVYPNIAALEEIAVARGVPIHEPFQGADIGHFRVLAPTRARYLDLVVQSEKTPEARATTVAGSGMLFEALRQAATTTVSAIRAAWGEEVFSTEETSAENEMSVVQYANLCGSRILLTGDAGRGGLTEAADFAPAAGLSLPGIERFQVPHHGSRRNVSSEILDRWLGPRTSNRPSEFGGKFTALISSAKKDAHHPRKVVKRALIHRGGQVFATEGRCICSASVGAPARGWNPITPEAYPEDQNET